MRPSLGEQRRRPTATAWPSTTPVHAEAFDVREASTAAGPPPAGPPRPPRSRRPIGCSDAASTAPGQPQQLVARRRRRRTRRRPALIRPVVTVPVLSSTTVSTRRVDSSTSGPLMRMPSWAPRPVPTSRAVGVARPSAHGQAMIRTATAAVKARGDARAGAEPEPESGDRRARSRSGRTPPEIRSASRCTGALPLCASSTSLAIWASWVSAPTRVARTTSRPPAFTVAPDHRVARPDLDGHRLAGQHARRRRPSDPPRRPRPSRPSPRAARRTGRRRRAARSGSAAHGRPAAPRRPWRPAPAAPAAPPRPAASTVPRSTARPAGTS